MVSSFREVLLISIFDILKIPEERVPVLSKIRVFISPNFCKISKFLNKYPSFLLRVAVLNNTIGVAKPNAQGHAITRTAIEFFKASNNAKSLIKNLNRKVRTLIIRTIGTKY